MVKPAETHTGHALPRTGLPESEWVDINASTKWEDASDGFDAALETVPAKSWWRL